MRKQRSIIAIAALLGLAGASPAAAAGPLLSGYGGPGQGNQAILGSALLNGPRGGGSSGGSSGGPPAAATASGPAPAGVSESVGGSGSTSPAPARSGGRRAHPGASGQGAQQQTTAGASDPAALYAALERRAAHSSGTMGVTGQDLAYILLGLAVLAFAGLFTSRLARAGAANTRPG